MPFRISSRALPSLTPGAALRRRGAHLCLAVGALLGWLALSAAAPASQREGMVETPEGEMVMVRHKIHPGGVIEDFYEYIDGRGNRVKHGPFKRTYRNGVMRELTTYRHGIRHGRFVARYESDVKQVEGHYKEGELHGRVIHYHPNGQVQTDAVYRDGELHGPFRRYGEDGRLREAGTFVEGRREGKYVEYNPDGSPYLAASFREGRMTGPVTLYSETGERLAEGVLADERIQGEWLCFAGGAQPSEVRTDCDGRAWWDCPCR